MDEEGSGRVEAAGTSYASSSHRDAETDGDDTLAGEMKVGGEEDVERDDDDDDAHGEVGVTGFFPGPMIPLREQLERDKEDESLRRWKEKLLGCIEGELNDQMEPVVIFHSVGIVTEGCPEIVTPLPVKENGNHVLFALKEGSEYRLKLTFSVQHNLVSGLAYSNAVWKGGLQVDQSEGMLGTFAPQREPYVHLLDEETTPSGIFARGIYSAKLKFEDDDKRCHLELDYSFEINRR